MVRKSRLPRLNTFAFTIQLSLNLMTSYQKKHSDACRRFNFVMMGRNDRVQYREPINLGKYIVFILQFVHVGTLYS